MKTKLSSIYLYRLNYKLKNGKILTIGDPTIERHFDYEHNLIIDNTYNYVVFYNGVVTNSDMVVKFDQFNQLLFVNSSDNPFVLYVSENKLLTSEEFIQLVKGSNPFIYLKTSFTGDMFSYEMRNNVLIANKTEKNKHISILTNNGPESKLLKKCPNSIAEVKLKNKKYQHIANDETTKYNDITDLSIISCTPISNYVETINSHKEKSISLLNSFVSHYKIKTLKIENLIKNI